MERLVTSTAPFTYPCIIEYSLICSAITYVMWKHTGKNPSKRKVVQYGEKNEVKESYSFDCHGANKGLFGGIMVLIFTLISLIMFFMVENNDEFEDSTAVITARCSEIILYVLSMIAVIGAFHRMRTLGYDSHHEMELDHILLLVAQTGLFMYSIFVIVGGHSLYKVENLLTFFAGITEFIQGTLQTMFLLHASRCYAKTFKHEADKPGRELVTFLIMANLSMWAVNTFETLNASLHPGQFEFYGMWAWTIILHLSMPLAIFYRFHSTVCLCEVWVTAYSRSHTA